MRSRNRAASGPLTSILPSGDPSKKTYRLAYRQYLARNRRFTVIAIEGRTLPGTVVIEYRALAGMPVVGGQPFRRAIEIAAPVTGDGAHGHRHELRPGRGGAHLPRGSARQLREQAQGAQVARLALVHRHAGRGVAFHVLHGDVVFAHGQFDVGGGYIVLEIHPLAAGAHRRWRAGPHTGAVLPGRTCRLRRRQTSRSAGSLSGTKQWRRSSYRSLPPACE